jgi:hypothetical protein
MRSNTLFSNFLFDHATSTSNNNSDSQEKTKKVSVADPNLAVPEVTETAKPVAAITPKVPKPLGLKPATTFSSQAFLNQGKTQENKDQGPSPDFLKALGGNIEFVSLAGGGSQQQAA